MLGDLVCARSAYTQCRANSTSTNVPDIIIDTGASASVCSLSTVCKLPPKALNDLHPSKSSFRPGDSRTFASMGIEYLSNSVAPKSINPVNRNGEPDAMSENARITLKIDVVDALIPCFLPRGRVTQDD